MIQNNDNVGTVRYPQKQYIFFSMVSDLPATGAHRARWRTFRVCQQQKVVVCQKHPFNAQKRSETHQANRIFDGGNGLHRIKVQNHLDKLTKVFLYFLEIAYLSFRKLLANNKCIFRRHSLDVF